MKYCKPWIEEQDTYNAKPYGTFIKHKLFDVKTSEVVAEYYIPSRNWTDEDPNKKWFWKLSRKVWDHISNDKRIMNKLEKKCGAIFDFVDGGNFCDSESKAKNIIESCVIISGYVILDEKFLVLT